LFDIFGICVGFKNCAKLKTYSIPTFSKQQILF
jgi:hypothetical protein